jgi:hypothetical protein
MYPFSYKGLPLTTQKVSPGDTVKSLSAYCYKYRVYKLVYDDQDTLLAAGDWVVGATSGAVGKVLYNSSSTVPNGTGYVLFDSWDGTAWTNNEEIKVGGTATCANVDQPAAIVEASDAEYALADRTQFKHMLAQFALVLAYSNTVLVAIDGGTPDQTALVGIPLVAGAGFELDDHNSMTRFKCIDYTSGSAGTLFVQFCF